jgi:DNA-3-methyladenine glycosylase
MKPLPLKFYRRDTTQVARELLGKQLFRLHRGQLTSGIIVETEAYLGIEDPAAHTFRGRNTQRVQSMYKMGGHAYVYFVYGMNF